MKSFFYHLNLWFSRINAWLSTGRHLHTARLAYPHETAKIAILKTHITRKVTAIYLAVGQFGQIMCLWPTKEQDELGNIFLDGMTRAGKGLTIETNLFTWPHSVIVNDIKGETVATIQSFSGVDSGNLAMYPGEQSITWRILPCPAASWHLWRDHRVFVPFATLQNWIEASGEKKRQREWRGITSPGRSTTSLAISPPTNSTTGPSVCCPWSITAGSNGSSMRSSITTLPTRTSGAFSDALRRPLTPNT